MWPHQTTHDMPQTSRRPHRDTCPPTSSASANRSCTPPAAAPAAAAAAAAAVQGLSRPHRSQADSTQPPPPPPRRSHRGTSPPTSSASRDRACTPAAVVVAAVVAAALDVVEVAAVTLEDGVAASRRCRARCDSCPQTRIRRRFGGRRRPTRCEFRRRHRRALAGWRRRRSTARLARLALRRRPSRGAYRAGGQRRGPARSEVPRMSPAPTPRCSLADRPQPRHAFAQGTALRDPRAALAGAAHAVARQLSSAVPADRSRGASIQLNFGGISVSRRDPKFERSDPLILGI